MLGVTNSPDMVMVRTECIKYCCHNLDKVSCQGRAPKFDIPKPTLAFGKRSKMANLLSVSERKIYRRMSKYGLSKLALNKIIDQELHSVVKRAKREFPMCGEKMIKQVIEQHGIKIQRWRLRDSIHRMDSIGVHERKR